jgi:ABC-type dipeptide/oligopeptide/nickel transport system ATPase component
MASVDIKGVQKVLRRHARDPRVDVSIADGEFAVLVGPSGCGKSTLLRMIAGLEEIGGGEISIGGRVVNNLPPKERDIAMVFQNYALYPHMKVRDNMAFSLLLAKRPRAEVDERVGKAAAILGPGRAPRPLPAPALRRPAPARGDGAARSCETRRCSSSTSRSRTSTPKLRVAMRTGAEGAAPAPEDHLGLRDARPDRGDDDGRQGSW